MSIISPSEYARRAKRAAALSEKEVEEYSAFIRQFSFAIESGKSSFQRDCSALTPEGVKQMLGYLIEDFPGFKVSPHPHLRGVFNIL